MARKNKKKPRRQRRRLSFPAKYGAGDRVRVKPGTTDPDFPDIPIGGWAGAICEANVRSNPPTYLIEWDQFTLDHMHPVYRKRCERDNLELERTWLGEADLEPDSGGPAVIEQPTRLVTRPLSKNDQDDRIRAIFGLTSDDPLPPATVENLHHYSRYLRSQLSFPFKGNCILETGPYRAAKCSITVVGLLDGDDWDEEVGVTCEAEHQGESVEMPLADVEATDSPDHRKLVEDYSYWFCNWPADDTIGPAESNWMLFDPHTAQTGNWVVVKALVTFGLYGAVCGIVLGSLLGSLEGAMPGALVVAAFLGLIGLAAGTKFGMEFNAENRLRYGSLVGGTLGTVGGALVGAVIGAMIVAYAGSLIGGIIGALVSRLLAKLMWKRIGPFVGAILGAVVGAMVLAFCHDLDKALVGAFHGAWLGFCGGILLVLAAAGSMALAVRKLK